MENQSKKKQKLTEELVYLRQWIAEQERTEYVPDITERKEAEEKVKASFLENGLLLGEVHFPL